MSDTVLVVLISSGLSLVGVISNILYNARKDDHQRRHDMYVHEFNTFTSRHLDTLITFSELLGKLVRFDYQTWTDETKSVELVETRRAYNAALYVLYTFASKKTCQAILDVGNPVGKKEESPDILRLRKCLRKEITAIRASLADFHYPPNYKPLHRCKRCPAYDPGDQIRRCPSFPIPRQRRLR